MHNLKRGHQTAANGRQQLLRYDHAQYHCQLYTDLLLLVGWEYVDDTIHRVHCAHGV